MTRPIAATVHVVEIPFRFVFKHALAARDRSASVVVALRDEAGNVGYGECAPRDYVSGETTTSVVDRLCSSLKGVLGHQLESLADARAMLEEGGEPSRDGHAAACALELALLDLVGVATDTPVGDVLGPRCAHAVHYSGIVSADDPAAVTRTCDTLIEFGIEAVKVKVGRDADTDARLLEIVRDRLGPSCSLRIDANCAWDADTALRRLERFEPFDLAAVEQPCAARDLDAMARVTAGTDVPVIADESLVGVDDARRLIDAGACKMFNVRISKCGGLLRSARIRDLARDAGLGFMLGAQVGETAVLSAAGRAFARHSDGCRFVEGSYGTLLLTDDLDDRVALGPRGVGVGVDGPGLGVSIDADRLARLSSAVHDVG